MGNRGTPDHPLQERIDSLASELAAAKNVIARYEQALEEIASGKAGWRMVDARITARKALA